MPLDTNGNGHTEPKWLVDRRLVLHELERLNIAVDKLDSTIEKKTNSIEKKIGALQTDNIMLKTQASLWGGIAASVVSTVIALVVSLIIK